MERPKSNFVRPQPRKTGVVPSTTRPVRTVPPLKDTGKIARVKPSRKISPNATTTCDLDASLMLSNQALNEKEMELTLAYSKMLSSIFTDSVIVDTAERQKDEVELQMVELAKRFEVNTALLEKTNRRLKEISFASEHQKLLEMKNEELKNFTEATTSDDTEQILDQLIEKEASCLDQVDLKNIDLGYSDETGHKQLLDALNDALKGFNDMKKQSNLSMGKLNEYTKCNSKIDVVNKKGLDIECLKKEYESMFPTLNEMLLIDASKQLSSIVDVDGTDTS